MGNISRSPLFERIRNVKRAALALVALGLTTFSVAPAFAASPQGAVQMKWNVAATAQLTLATNYVVATGLQSLGANNLQGSPAATCTSAVAETALTMTFGALTASSTLATACNYQRAVLANVVTNDSLGYKLNEWLDQAPTAGITFGAYTNGFAVAPAAPASVNAVAPAPGGGSILPAGSAPSGAGPGQPGTAGIRTATAPGLPYVWASTAAATAGTNWGEDIQINLSANQASSAADTSYIIIQLVPN
jgi:hypothetical protein